jgi:hypothetical protein
MSITEHMKGNMVDKTVSTRNDYGFPKTALPPDAGFYLTLATKAAILCT